MVEVLLFVDWFGEVCPLQDVKNIDVNIKYKIEMISLYVVICLNIFVRALNCFWFAGGRS
jgi:hypothetical protein